MSSPPDDTFIEAALQDFSRQLHSKFPLRNFGEFYDDKQLREKILQLKDSVSENFFSKVSVMNKDEEVFSLLMKLRLRMNNEVIAEWMAKNKKHRMESISLLQKRAELLCEDFQMALEDQLLLNPDIEMELLKKYVDSQKVFAINYLGGIWEPRNSQIREERKAKMVKSLDTIGEEMLEKHKHVLERLSVDEGTKLVDQVKAIIVEKSRQLKSYVDSHSGQVSKRYLKLEVEDIMEYLSNGKGSALRESRKEIYSMLVETLEDGIKFLTEEEGDGNAKPAEDILQWAERFHLKLKSNCSVDEGFADEAQRIQQEANGRDSSDGRCRITMQQILKEDPFGLWEQKGREPESSSCMEGGDDTLTGINVLKVNDAIQIVEKSSSGANDRLKPGTSGKRSMRLRRSRPLKRSSVKDKDRKLINVQVHTAKLDSSMSKMHRTDNVSRETKNPDTTLHRQRSKLNKKTNDSAQAAPSRRSSRLKKNSHVRDQTTESSHHDTDTLKHCKPRRPHPKPENTNRRTNAVGKSNELSSPNLSISICLDRITCVRENPPTFKCDVCKKEITKRGYLKYHGKFCWKASPKHKCDRCGKGFHKKCNLVNHIRTHTGERPFKCLKCDKQFVRNEILLAHTLSHRETTDELTFNCVTCNRQFCHKFNYVRHIRRKHGKSKEEADKQANDAVAEYGGKMMNNPNHDGDISSTGVSSSAVEKANLSPSGISGKSSSTLHGKSSNKDGHECNYCGKKLPTMSHLVTHRRIHTGEKPFKCPTCSKQFAHKSNLQAHSLSQTCTGQAPFTCERCKKGFRYRYSLDRHMLRHEGKLPLGCSYCDHRCDTMTNLQQHVLSHCDERPFACPTCERRFSWKQHLVQHIRRLHLQPKVDAMKLADKASVDYLKKVTNNPNYDGDTSSATVLWHAIKKANLKVLPEIYPK